MKRTLTSIAAATLIAEVMGSRSNGSMFPAVKPEPEAWTFASPGRANRQGFRKVAGARGHGKRSGRR